MLLHLCHPIYNQVHFFRPSFVFLSLCVSKTQELLQFVAQKKQLLTTSKVCGDLAQALPVEQYERAELPVVLYLVRLLFVEASLNCYCCSCAPLP